MALFNPSTIPWATACQTIADSIGASADNEMTNRAHRSLRAAFQFLGGKYRWDYLRTEYIPQQVYPPFQIAVTASAGVASASALTGHGVLTDDVLMGSGLMLSVRVTATGASGFGFSVALTGFTGAQNFTMTAVRDMYAAPSDLRNGYTIRLLGDQRALRYIQRRGWDRAITDEFSAGTVEGYDLSRLAERGKVRLLPPPGTADVLLQRYYRRFSLPSVSATGQALDIQEDYEEIPIAWAKWHFLTDKGEGRKQQAQTWMSLAQDGMKQMLAEQSNLPDQVYTFTPGAMPIWDDSRSTRWLDWTYT